MFAFHLLGDAPPTWQELASLCVTLAAVQLVSWLRSRKGGQPC